MDPLLRWAIVTAIVLPLFVMTRRVDRAYAARHPGLWLELRSARRWLTRMGHFWGDAHVSLGDPELSGRIWQYRFVAMAVGVLMVLFAAASSPTCIGLPPLP